MVIADLPVQDRPRERLATLGTGALADRELLAVLLGTGGGKGVGAHQLAERLLATFGSVAGVARAHLADLARVAGVGQAKASALAAAFELARRASTGAPTTRAISGPGEVASVTASMLRGRTRERLVVVICDRARRVLGCEVVSEGSADKALVPVREVVVAVLRRDGHAFALAHNHPGGDPAPSRYDWDATARVEDAAHASGIQLLHHVIVTDTDWRAVY